MESAATIVLVAVGAGIAARYLRASRIVGAQRPWRRVGAVICLLLSVMFVVGLYVLDEKGPPALYLTYWLFMMLLVVWLLALAVQDILYTRKLIARWRVDQERAWPRGRAGAFCEDRKE